MGDEEDCDTETIEQLHLTTWPDHSVPSNLANLLGRHKFQEIYYKSEAPYSAYKKENTFLKSTPNDVILY